MERKDRNRNGGGVVVYIKDDIQYSRRNDIENDNMESLWIEIQQVHKKSIVIGTLHCTDLKRVTSTLIFLLK